MTDTVSSSTTSSSSTGLSSSSNSALTNIPTAQMGGKKKNGHKATCGCPICVNMKHSKRGGYDMTDEDMSDEGITTVNTQSAGKKRKGNGHKANCKCPICKNMRKKHGGDSTQEPDIENQIGDIEEGFESGTGQSMSDTETVNESPATDNEYDDYDAAEKGEAGSNKVGGTRRYKKRGTKKSRKSKKSRKTYRKQKRHGKRSHRRN